MAKLKKAVALNDILTLTAVSNTAASNSQKDFYLYGGASSVFGIVDLKPNEFHDTFSGFPPTILTSNFDYLLSSNLLGKQTKEIDAKEIELSNLQITGDGIISDKWDKIENIESRIIEVSDQDVILECLVDYENKTFENRIFPKNLIEGIP